MAVPLDHRSLERLPADFYAASTVEIARSLLGHVLMHDTPEGPCGGVIVETEAYLRDDPGCHAARGMTRRNAAMFGPPGTAYVYLIYGMHYCLNVVTAPEGVGEAVLIRALEPVVGVDLMVRRRGTQDMRALCSGPARLCQALGITADHNRSNLVAGPLFLARNSAQRLPQPPDIVTTTRIGLREGRGSELPLRFYLRNNKYISRR